MQDPSDHTGQKSDRNPSAIRRNGPEAACGKVFYELLLVADETNGVEFAAMLLRSYGLDVLVVHSATHALRARQDANHFDALSNVRMPDITGLELADKIILMSGYAAPQLPDQPFQFITKPYRIDALLDLLDRSGCEQVGLSKTISQGNLFPARIQTANRAVSKTFTVWATAARWRIPSH